MHNCDTIFLYQKLGEPPMSVQFNILSIILGLSTLLCFLLSLALLRRSMFTSLLFNSISLLSAIFSVLFQIGSTNELVKVSDWSAIIDTHNAIWIVSLLFVLVVFLLQIIYVFTLRKHV